MMHGYRNGTGGTRCQQACERASSVMIWTAALCVAGLFLWIVGDIISHGISHLSLSFLVESPSDAGRGGGIAPIIVSTLWVLCVAMSCALPLGISTALFLAEYTRLQTRWAGFIRLSLELLAAVPSIVFGLVGSAFFSLYLGMGFSILAGGLTLACMILPIFIRSAEEGFRAVPVSYRHTAAALGFSQWRIVWSIVMPAAAPALLAGFVLGIGRAMAETAALIFTSGYVDRMPESVYDSGRVMSIHIYDLAMNVPGGNDNAYATALVLIAVLLCINGCASWISRRMCMRMHHTEGS